MEDNILEEKLRRSEIKNYILEEENSLLRENVECLLIDFENFQKKEEELKKEQEIVKKITSGKIYKILRKIKTLGR